MEGEQSQQEKLAQKFITELTKDDVLLGRGTGSNENIGNIRFRKVLAEVMRKEGLPEEKGPGTRVFGPETKERVANRVISIIRARKGRFVQKLSKAEVQQARYSDPIFFASLPIQTDLYRLISIDEATKKARSAIRFQLQKEERRAARTGGKAVADGDGKRILSPSKHVEATQASQGIEMPAEANDELRTNEPALGAASITNVDAAEASSVIGSGNQSISRAATPASPLVANLSQSSLQSLFHARQLVANNPLAMMNLRPEAGLSTAAFASGAQSQSSRLLAASNLLVQEAIVAKALQDQQQALAQSIVLNSLLPSSTLPQEEALLRMLVAGGLAPQQQQQSGSQNIAGLIATALMGQPSGVSSLAPELLAQLGCNNPLLAQGATTNAGLAGALHANLSIRPPDQNVPSASAVLASSGHPPQRQRQVSEDRDDQEKKQTPPPPA